jgi:hypothetical protein
MVVGEGGKKIAPWCSELLSRGGGLILVKCLRSNHCPLEHFGIHPKRDPRENSEMLFQFLMAGKLKVQGFSMGKLEEASQAQGNGWLGLEGFKSIWENLSSKFIVELLLKRKPMEAYLTSKVHSTRLLNRLDQEGSQKYN